MAYFVYVNGDSDAPKFDGKLEFDVTLIPHTGMSDWVEPVLIKIKECLESQKCPLPTKTCEFCAYRAAMQQALLKAKEIGAASEEKKTLF